MKANSLGLILIAGALFFFLGRPQLSALDSLRQEKDSYKQAIDDLHKVEARKNELLAKLESVPAEDQRKINIILPEKPNIVALVSEIDSIASKRGITVRNINSGQQASFSGAVGEVPPEKNYSLTTLSFDFDSSYDNMKYLLTELEGSLRLLDIRSVDFGVSDKAGQQTYKVSMDVYWAGSPSI
jgi:Tfp pilus assembly protein PilO